MPVWQHHTPPPCLSGKDTLTGQYSLWPGMKTEGIHRSVHTVSYRRNKQTFIFISYVLTTISFAQQCCSVEKSTSFVCRHTLRQAKALHPQTLVSTFSSSSSSKQLTKAWAEECMGLQSSMHQLLWNNPMTKPCTTFYVAGHVNLMITAQSTLPAVHK